MPKQGETQLYADIPIELKRRFDEFEAGLVHKKKHVALALFAYMQEFSIPRMAKISKELDAWISHERGAAADDPAADLNAMADEAESARRRRTGSTAGRRKRKGVG